ncbi:MAG: hypothetical protein IKL59_05235 [Clostridia bacterium]|nr:hypothetical protein [Clostridia bacterium]
MKRTKHDTNTAKIYFTQNRWTWVDTASVVMIAAGALLSFMRGLGPIGLPLILIGAIVKIFSGNAKVKDSDYDEELQKLINANYIETHRQINDDYTDVAHKITLCNYDIGKAPVILGKDHKLRASDYYVSTFEFNEGKCKLEIYKINVPEKKVELFNYSLSLPCGYEVIEKPSVVPEKLSHMLKLDGVPEIPVDINSTDTDIILKKLK